MDRRGRLDGAAAIAATLALVAGCSTQATSPPSLGPSVGPTLGLGTPSAASPSAASGTGRSTETLTAAPFDPAAISMTLQPYATIPGGPLAITAPKDGSGRLFVAAQDGRAWVIDHGSPVGTPLLDLRNLVTTGGERGLLGIAVHPGFPTDPRVFVDYTDRNGNTVVASYAVSTTDPNVLDPASASIVLQVGQPYPNHNGGALAFGPDGDLYVSLGDGGSEGDPQGNGQRLDTDLAKILRIDVDHQANGLGYSIPPGNPFVGRDGARPEIWLTGLRNPWRLSFDRLTGDLWIGDVGQNAWEEVDVARAGQSGLNFGWNRMEADHCYRPSSGCDQAGLTLPVAEFDHQHGCAVIGGVVYRGSQQPLLAGGYVYSDNCSGIIWALDAASAAPGDPPSKAPQVGKTDAGIAAFGEDEAGELYAANLNGTISRVVAAPR